MCCPIRESNERSTEPTPNPIDDSIGGTSVAVWILEMSHGFVRGIILQKTRDLVFDQTSIGSDESDGPGCDPLGALGGVTHDEHGLAETGRFLLNTAESVRSSLEPDMRATNRR